MSEEDTSAQEKAEFAAYQVKQLRERVEDLEAVTAELQDEVEHLRRENERLRDRTDLQEVVQSAASGKPVERLAVLVQTLYNEAWTKLTDDTNSEPVAEMTAREGVKSLGGSVSRRNVYTAFEKVAEVFDDDDPIEYVREDRSSSDKSRLRINLRDGDMPAAVAGHEITTPDVGGGRA